MKSKENSAEGPETAWGFRGLQRILNVELWKCWKCHILIECFKNMPTILNIYDLNTESFEEKERNFFFTLAESKDFRKKYG